MNLRRFEIINYNFTTSIKLHSSWNMPCNIWYICNSDLHKSLLLLHTFSYTCACRTCASIQYRNSNIFMSLVQSKYLCNIIIHTLMYTCTINVYMHTVQVCSYVCSRPNTCEPITSPSHVGAFLECLAKHKATDTLKLYIIEGYIKYRVRPNKYIGLAVPS